MRTAQLDLLDQLTRVAGAEYDPSLAREIIGRGERELPGPLAERWAERLDLAGRDFGLRVQPVAMTTRKALEVIRPGAPVVAYHPGTAGDSPRVEAGQGHGHAEANGHGHPNGHGHADANGQGGSNGYGTRDHHRAAGLSGPVAGGDAGDEGGTWYILVDRKGRWARIVAVGATREERWITERELARRLGAPGVHAPLHWALIQSMTPCEGVRLNPNAHLEDDEPDRGLPEHGHGPHHGHGHGNGVGGTHHEPHPFKRLLGLIRPEGRDLLMMLIFAVVVGVLYLGTPIAVESLVQFVAFGGLVQPVVMVSLILMTVLGLAAAIMAFQTYVVETLQRRIFARVVADLSYRLPRVNYETLDRMDGVELVNRFFDVITVQKAASTLLLDGLGLLLQTVIGMAVLAFYHPFLLGYDAILASLMLFTLFVLGRGAVRTSVRESLSKYAVAGWLEEMVRHPLTFRISGGPEYAHDRADGLTRDYLKARSAHFRILFRQIFFALGMQVVAGTALLALGGWLVVDGQMTLGQLVAAELIVTVIVGSFAKVGKYLEVWYDLMAAMNKLGHLIDLPLERRGGERHRADQPGASLRLIGTSYAYTGGHHDVLDRMNLTIRPGERVAIVGSSGSGKSTLVELLYGLRTPTGGAIELDGADVRDLRLESLREHVVAVKGFDIVEGSLVDNVRMGRERLSLSQVRDALDAVGLLDEVRDMPDGMQTWLTPNGSPLSRGQAKRLMLARAIVGRPRLLIVDEILDALDVDARMQVCDTLFDPTRPWTLIVVTHHGDVARLCDRTLRLDHGRLEELPTAAARALLEWKVG